MAKLKSFPENFSECLPVLDVSCLIADSSGFSFHYKTDFSDFGVLEKYPLNIDNSVHVKK